MRVLISEDNSDDVRGIARVLKTVAEDVEILHVRDGEEA